MNKNIIHKSACFVLVVLFMSTFLYIPGLHAQEPETYISVFDYVDKDVQINITAYFSIADVKMDCKVNKTPTLISDFDKHGLYYYNITAEKNYQPLNSTITFTLIDNLDMSRITAYYLPMGYVDKPAKWSKAESQEIKEKKVIVKTKHFSDWSIVYADWGHRQYIWVNGSNISAPLVNFPVLVNLTSTNFNFSASNINGSDLRFTDGGDAPLSFEIEKFNKNNSTAQIWVKLPLINATTNTTFLLYYNNSTAVPAQDPNNVWDSNFKLVQHYKETNASGYYIADSTSNNHNGSVLGTKYTDLSKTDGGRIFGGSKYDYIEMNDSADWALGSTFTISFNTLFYSAWQGNTYFMGQYVDGSYWFPQLYGGYLGWGNPGGNFNAGIFTPVTGRWYNLTWACSGGTLTCYVDVNSMGSVSIASVPDYALTLKINNNIAGTVAVCGIMDEVRISNVARNLSWIQATCRSANDSLLLYGVEEDRPTAPPPPTTGHKYPNHVSYPNYQNEYVCIQLNDSANVTSECWVMYPSGYSRNYSFTDDKQLYIYGNETGKYNYSYYLNASETRFNGSFVVVLNAALTNMYLYNDVVNKWVFGVICFALFWILFLLSRKHLLFGISAIALATYMLAFQQTWLPYWISIILMVLAWFSALRQLFYERREEG